MDYSKLNDYDITRVCLEILRPYIAEDAQATPQGYLTADLERCGFDTTGKVHMELHTIASAPAKGLRTIDGYQLANYCTTHPVPLGTIWRNLRALFFAYCYTMDMALAKIQDRQDIEGIDPGQYLTRYQQQWIEHWDSVQQPIEYAAAILLREHNQTAAEREALALVQAHCEYWDPLGDLQQVVAEEMDPQDIAQLWQAIDGEPAAAETTTPEPVTPAPSFAACIQYRDTARLLERLHQLIDQETSPASVGAIFYRALSLGYLKRYPGWRAMCAEFPNVAKLSRSGIYNYMPREAEPDAVLLKAQAIIIFAGEDEKRCEDICHSKDKKD